MFAGVYLFIYLRSSDVITHKNNKYCRHRILSYELFGLN